MLWLYTTRINGIAWDQNASDVPFEVINQNWTNFWDKLDLYVYVVGDVGDAVGYRLTNSSSNAATDTKQYSFDSPALDRIVNFTAYDVDISAIFNSTYNETYVQYRFRPDLFEQTDPFGIFQESLIPVVSFFPALINREVYYSTDPLNTPFYLTLGSYPIEPIQAKYVGMYFHLAEDADVDFNDDGVNESLYLTEACIQCGQSQGIGNIIYDLEMYDIAYVAIMSIFLILFLVWDSKDKALQQTRHTCNIRQFSESNYYRNLSREN